MSELEVNGNGNGKMVLDLTSQAQIANTNQKLAKRILKLLKEIASEDAQKGEHRGALIVLGEFVRFDYKIPGMRQIGTNPLKGRAIFFTGEGIRDELEPLLSEDGAIIVDTTSQMMAAQVYLGVLHGEAEIEEECSTRHISAASYSMNEHVIACFTLSEETNKVRHYVDGVQMSVFDPHIKTEEDGDMVEL